MMHLRNPNQYVQAALGEWAQSTAAFPLSLGRLASKSSQRKWLQVYCYDHLSIIKLEPVLCRNSNLWLTQLTQYPHCANHLKNLAARIIISL